MSKKHGKKWFLRKSFQFIFLVRVGVVLSIPLTTLRDDYFFQPNSTKKADHRVRLPTFSWEPKTAIRNFNNKRIIWNQP